jgi:hypothetical protein
MTITITSFDPYYTPDHWKREDHGDILTGQSAATGDMA